MTAKDEEGMFQLCGFLKCFFHYDWGVKEVLKKER